MFRKLKILWVALLSILLTALLLIEYMDEKLPEGTPGPEAEALAKKMLSAINDEAWRATGAVSWGYADRTFIWDKKRHFTEVKYEGNHVLLDINARKGVILKSEESELSNESQQALCETAWKYWCNDSFWLNPVSKIFDPGTKRSIVDRHGRQGLLVTYTTGGATPGDSYLWFVDENGRPKSWKLWVSIIPIGGMNFGWDEWVQLETGVWISTHHFNPVKTVRVHQPVGKEDLLLITGKDIFEPLLRDSSALVSF